MAHGLIRRATKLSPRAHQLPCSWGRRLSPRWALAGPSAGAADGAPIMTRTRHPFARLVVACMAILEVAVVVLVSASPASAATPIAVKTTKGVAEFLVSASGTRFSWTHNTKANPNHYDLYLTVGGSTRKVNAAGTQGFGGGI